MTGGDQGNSELVVSKTEIEKTLPVELQYAMSVDAMTQGVAPDRGTYFNILVYGAKGGEPGQTDDQPSVKILRSQHGPLLDTGGMSLQDTLNVHTKDYGVEFNAEKDKNGTYVSYDAFGLRGIQYLTEVVKEFTRMGKLDGSEIWINHQLRMVAKNGVWETVEDERVKRPPRPPQIGAPPPQLDAPSSKALPDNGEKPAQTILNILLGLAARKAKRSSGVPTFSESGD